MRGKTMRHLSVMVAVAVVLALAAGTASAAVKYITMDKFKPTFQVLQNGAYARYYPSSMGGNTIIGPFTNYGGCAKVKLPVGATISEIQYNSSGSSGWSFSFLAEYRYGAGAYRVLFNDNVSYPSAADKTMDKIASDTTIRKKARYTLCVEGQPANDIWGYKILYTKP